MAANDPRAGTPPVVEMAKGTGKTASASVTTQVDPEMQACIDACTRCHQVCLDTIQYCLSMGGDHADPAHIALLQDCAQICATSADFMLRGSDFHPSTCSVCADVCEACADDCDTFEGDETMARCAEICRACAESCLSMASHGE